MGPREDLERFNVTEDDLIKGVRDESYIQMLQFQIARAREWYARAESGIPMLAEDAGCPFARHSTCTRASSARSRQTRTTTSTSARTRRSGRSCLPSPIRTGRYRVALSKALTAHTRMAAHAAFIMLTGSTPHVGNWLVRGFGYTI